MIAAATATLHAEALTILQAHPLGEDNSRGCETDGADSAASQGVFNSRLSAVGVVIGAFAVLAAVTTQYKRNRVFRYFFWYCLS